MANDATATCWPGGIETGTVSVVGGVRARAYHPGSPYSTNPIDDGLDSLDSDCVPAVTQDHAEIVASFEGSIVEASGETVSVQLRDRETILDLPRSLFIEQPRYGALVDYAVLRRQDNTRFQRVSPIARELSTAHIAEFERLLADID